MNKFLYVGCGNHRLIGFTHVEIDFSKTYSKGTVVKPPEILCDITKKIPLGDNSVELIYSSETMEHLKYREFLNHLIESHRILMMGGIVRICVPDLDQFVLKFIERKADIENEKKFRPQDPDFPISNYSELFVNEIMYEDHFYNHNFETLSACLKTVGFGEIKRCVAGDYENDNQQITFSIKEAEKNRNELLIVAAKKINTNTSIGKFDLVNKVNILNHILEKYLNLHIGPANHRKTYFPKKNFFKEKIYMIKNYFLK